MEKLRKGMHRERTLTKDLANPAGTVEISDKTYPKETLEILPRTHSPDSHIRKNSETQLDEAILHNRTSRVDCKVSKSIVIMNNTK